MFNSSSIYVLTTRHLYVCLLTTNFMQTVRPHVQIDYDDINLDSDHSAHSNHLCRWIGTIWFQIESAQCEFHVDAINSN